MDGDTYELLGMLPCRPEDVPVRLSEALREAKEKGVVRETFSPDGEGFLLLLGNEKTPES